VVPVTSGPASADPDHPVPTQQQVDKARERTDRVRISVEQIEQQLAAANRELNRLQVKALQAAQRYDGAVAEYQRDRRLAHLAQVRANRLERQTEQVRRHVAQVAINQSMTGGSSTMLGTAMKTNGQRQLLESASTYQSTEQYLQALHQKLSAKSHLADVYQKQADAALAKAAAAKRRAAEAKVRAEQAVAAEQRAVEEIAVVRRHLIHRLAATRHISLALANQRQLGIEQQRRERLERQRQQQLIAAEHQQQQTSTTPTPPGGRHGTSTPAPRPAPSPRPSPAPSPSPGPLPAPSPHPGGTGATKAIRFAMAQLGEPYVWGGAGPDVWDCSGLTMMAWRAAGVYLDHYAPTQYLETTPVSYSQLRPGDLVYWATNRSRPATIFHAAMYIGNGQVIEAPHTGDVVKIIGMLAWQTPAFFGRP
jgi:peptidoglycan DL-endopeptidase CwlO